MTGHTVAQVVEALHHKPEGHSVDSLLCHWNCLLSSSFGRTMALVLTQLLTEMSARNISWGVKAASAYGWQPYRLHVPTI
jgi:hypothetical protein